MTQFDVLCQRVRSILLTDWDPIGIRDVSGAGDEYDAYVVPIAKRLMAGDRPSEVAKYLLETEVGSLGLNGNAPRARAIAEKLRGIAVSPGR
jgi:hypothetical protein